MDVMIGIEPEKGEPVHQITEKKNDGGPFQYFPYHMPRGPCFPFFPDKTHGIANGKKKRGKYKIGSGKAIPLCMKQRRKGSGFIARRVHNDHEAKRHSPENIQCNIPFWQGETGR